MSISFNADEIFEMAEEIERNGAKFYRTAAEKTSDAEAKTMFLDFAEMEEGHLAIFEVMRKALNDKEKEMIDFDPDGEAAMYLQSMAGAYGYEGRKDMDEVFTGVETPLDVINAAIQAEKNSVAFYVGIKDLVPAKCGKDKVDGVIKEEMQHLTTLNNQLAKMR